MLLFASRIKSGRDDNNTTSEVSFDSVDKDKQPPHCHHPWIYIINGESMSHSTTKKAPRNMRLVWENVVCHLIKIVHKNNTCTVKSSGSFNWHPST